MATHNPSYITQNRLGIFIFQVRIPAGIRHNSPFFRKSLRTRNRSEALSHARRLMCMFDDIKARFFDDEAQYKKAMEILGDYELGTTGNWESVEKFLTNLNSYDSHLLEQAIDYETIKKKKEQAGTSEPQPQPQPHCINALTTFVKVTRWSSPSWIA